jgi:uncharacterized protein (TIGR02118 family)
MSSRSNITVLYATSEDGNGRFDVDYYVSQHMALVEKAWEKVSIQSWQVVKFAPFLNGAATPYHAAAIVTFDSRDGANNALAAEATKEVFGDVPNFSNLKPLLMVGDLQGAWVRS